MNDKAILMAWGLVLTALGAAGGMSGCGGAAGAQSAAQAYSTVNLASGFLSNMRFDSDPSTTISSGVAGFSGRPGQGVALQLRSAEEGGRAAACGYSTVPDVASKVDADSDGICTSLTWTYNYDSDACGTTASGIKWTFKGKHVEKDLDDGLKWMLGGFEMTWDYEGTSSFPAVTSGSGKTYPASKFTYVSEGKYTGKASGSSYVHQSGYQGRVGWAAGAKSGSYDYTGTFKHVVTPDSLTAANAYKTGKVQIGGTWSYVGMVPEEEDHGSSSGGAVDITFTASSKDLTYDSTCSSYWKTGSFFYDLGNGHVFEYRYSCSAVKYFYDGKEYDPTAT